MECLRAASEGAGQLEAGPTACFALSRLGNTSFSLGNSFWNASLADARRFGFDSADEACVTMREVEAVANEIVAEYNTTPHEGLMKRQPALLIEHELNRHGIVNFADLESFRIDTMAIKDGALLHPEPFAVQFKARVDGLRDKITSCQDD